MRTVRSGMLRCVGAAALLMALALLALIWKIDQFGRVDQARRADVIIVLGAQVKSNGQPGPDLAARTQHAIDLYRNGLAPNLITTGGFVNEPLSAAAVARRTALAAGVPDARVFMAEGSQSTQEDAAVAAQVMRDHGWRTAILVSHPLHLYRAQLLFQDAGLHVYSSPTSTKVDEIEAPWRLYYATREAASLLWSGVHDWPLFRPFADRVQSWVYQGYVAFQIVK